uniref:Uncharacterized protein n=1 Tax=Neospora caninum (strain Liverpool) TaxID=572307 RepID=A0A0F7UIH6_NEOCL|nr:TPA: hypothetical protein BN1204_045830 [Neospora caninum Liverpool]
MRVFIATPVFRFHRKSPFGGGGGGLQPTAMTQISPRSVQVGAACASSLSSRSSSLSSGEEEQGADVSASKQRRFQKERQGKMDGEAQRSLPFVREAPLRVSARLFLRQCDYLLSCQLSSPPSPALPPSRCFLSVSARHESSGALYAGRFPHSFIEEMTRRTGRFASVDAFWELLLRAVRRRAGEAIEKSRDGEDEDVTLNLWDVTDLEALRRSAGGEKPSSPASSEDKHFLILTHSAGSRRVHYPLALHRQSETREETSETAAKGREGARVTEAPTPCLASPPQTASSSKHLSHPPRSLALSETKPTTPRSRLTHIDAADACASQRSCASSDGSIPRLGPVPVAAVELSSARSVSSAKPAASLSPRSPASCAVARRETARRPSLGNRAETTDARAKRRDLANENSHDCEPPRPLLARRDGSRDSLAGCQGVEHGDGALNARLLAARLEQVERELHVTARQLDTERHLRERETARLKAELEKARRTENALRNRVRELEATLRLTTVRPFRSPSASSLLPQSVPRLPLVSPRVSSASSSRLGSAAAAPDVSAPGPKAAASRLLRRVPGSVTASRAPSDSGIRYNQQALSPGRLDAVRGRMSPLSFLSRSPGFSASSAAGVRTPGVAVRYVRRGGGALVPVPVDESPAFPNRGRERRRSAGSASLANSGTRCGGRERASSWSASVDDGASRGMSSRLASRPPLSRSASMRLASADRHSPSSSLRASSPRPAFSAVSSVSSREGPPRGAPALRAAVRCPSPVHYFSSLSRPATCPRGGQTVPMSPSRVWGDRDSSRGRFGDSMTGSRRQLLRGVELEASGAAGGFQGRRIRSSLQESACSVASSRGVSSWARPRGASRDTLPSPVATYSDEDEGFSASSRGLLPPRREPSGGVESLHAPHQPPTAPGLSRTAKGDSRGGDSSYVMIPVEALKQLLRNAPEKELEEPHRPAGASLPLEGGGEAVVDRKVLSVLPEHASCCQRRQECEAGPPCGDGGRILPNPREPRRELSFESQEPSSEQSASYPGHDGCSPSQGDSIAGSEMRLHARQAIQGGAAPAGGALGGLEALVGSATLMGPAFREEPEGPSGLFEGPAALAPHPGGVGKASLPHLRVDGGRRDGSPDGAGSVRGFQLSRKETPEREREDMDERVPVHRSATRLVALGRGGLHPGENEDNRGVQRLQKEAHLFPQEPASEQLGAGDGWDPNGDRKGGFVRFPDKRTETESGRNAYSEIDRRLSALQEFLKSTRQTFKMLERAESAAP